MARYPAPGMALPAGATSGFPVAPLDFANGQRHELAGSVWTSAAVPEGCDMVEVSNLGAQTLYVRSDGQAVDAAGGKALPVYAYTSRALMVTGPARTLSIDGPSGVAVSVVPYLPEAS